MNCRNIGLLNDQASSIAEFRKDKPYHQRFKAVNHVCFSVGAGSKLHVYNVQSSCSVAIISRKREIIGPFFVISLFLVSHKRAAFVIESVLSNGL